jgi:uncharacterized membrane protein
MKAPPGVAIRDDPRLPEIDRLRGLVMVVMALDHMRDFFDADALRFSATNLDRTYPLLFVTRFITHFCAPTFALLAGVGAYFYGIRRKDPRALSLFLATRGVWLILLDISIVSPVWGGPGRIALGTLWAIGCGLLALSVLSLLPQRAVFAVGAAIILGHNLFDGLNSAELGAFAPLWRLLHEQGPLPFGLSGGVHYPALPWIGVVALGYGLGPLVAAPPAARDRVLRLAGMGAFILFALLRSGNFYGDPHPWAMQRDALFTIFSFFNVTKYPPSLLYLLVTLGGAALLLPWLARLDGPVGRALAIFGRTPLFFYVLHLYLGVTVAVALAYAKGYRIDDIATFFKSGEAPANFGIGLAGAYAAWVAVVLVLYPACRWFAGVKRRRADLWWLSYL